MIDFTTTIPSEHSLPHYLGGLGQATPDEIVRAKTYEAFADSHEIPALRAELGYLGVAQTLIDTIMREIEERMNAWVKLWDDFVRLRDTPDGLSPDFFFKGNDVWMKSLDKGSGVTNEIRISSYMNALYRTTGADGLGASLIVEVRNVHGEMKQARLPMALVGTNKKEAAKPLLDAGLHIYSSPEKAVMAIENADVLPARYVDKAGFYKLTHGSVFAYPSGVLGGHVNDETVIWSSGSTHCRPAQAGSLDEWKTHVAEPCEGNAIPMASIGTMLASPAISFLPPDRETNTILHLLKTSSSGKTISMQIGASVWGQGTPPSSPDSFINSWRTTSNSIENMLTAHNHVGILLDEIKTIAPKDASQAAYNIASGHGKARNTATSEARPVLTWELFALSSGELTLADQANEGAFRRITMDAGAETRVINLYTENILPSPPDGVASSREFAEMLGKAASRYYGRAGPVFVEWLLTHSVEASERLSGLLALWGALAHARTSDLASPQAKRVASRLGVIAACAALAADVVGLPWTLGLAPRHAEFEAENSNPIAGAAGKAMLWAFVGVLNMWLASAGGGLMSTEEQALLDELHSLFKINPRNFYKAIQGIGTLPDQEVNVYSHPIKRFGWDVFDKDDKHLHVDVLSDVFVDEMGWTKQKRLRAMRALKKRGQLILTTADELTNRHYDKDGVSNVYRIEASFFDE